MNEKRRLLKNTGIIAIGGMCTKAVSFLLLPLYTALLSATEYGTVDYVTTLAAFCVPVMTLLMDEAIFRYLIDYEDAEGRTVVMTTAILVCGVGTVVFCFIALPILISIRYEYSFWLFGMALSSSAVGMIGAILRGMGRSDLYALFSFISGASTIILNVTFIAIFRWGVVGMLSAYVVAQGSASVIFFVAQRLWRYVSLSKFNRVLAKDMLSYSLPLLPNRVAWLIMNLSSRVVIVGSLGAAQNGLYSVASRFPTIMDTIYGFFYLSWKESAARSRNSGESEKDFYIEMYGLLRRATFSLTLLLIAFMPVIFSVLINEQYSEAIVYVPVLLFAMYNQNMSGFYGGIFSAYKDTKIMGTTTIVAAVVNLGLNLILIPFAGLYGAAFATFVSIGITSLWRLRSLRKYVVLMPSRKETALFALFAIVSMMLFYFARFEGFWWLTIVNMVLTSVFFLCVNRRVLLSAVKEMRRHFARRG